VDADKIEASYKDGVLRVRLPKKPEAIKPERKIEVKAG
jgi:HSP20 family protein